MLVAKGSPQFVDVRDNNGGDRDPLMLLYSYLAASGDPPRVFNAAAYRLHRAHPENHLAETTTACIAPMPRSGIRRNARRSRSSQGRSSRGER